MSTGRCWASCYVKEHLETRLAEMDKRYEAAQTFQRHALEDAKRDLDRRLEQMNEFRAQLQDQAATFQTKEKSDVEIAHLQNRVLAGERWRSDHDGKSAGNQLYAIVAVIISAISMIATILLHFIKP